MAAAAALAAAGERSRARAGLRYFRYHSDLPHPVPARSSYVARPPGQGWPEQCPPIQAAQAFGWDVINPFTMRFVRGKEGWEIGSAVEVQGGDLEERVGVEPFPQQNCWPWDSAQILPHRISPHVFPQIRHQVKVSTYLFLQTPPGWALLMSDIPNLKRNFSVISAFLDTDWYFPAHPWHCVIELPQGSSEANEVVIPEGALLCRLTPVRRGAYVATELLPEEFNELFNSGQRWLEEHGRPSEDPEAGGALDITRAYKKQQQTATFEVEPAGSGASAASGAAASRRRSRASPSGKQSQSSRRAK